PVWDCKGATYFLQYNELFQKKYRKIVSVLKVSRKILYDFLNHFLLSRKHISKHLKRLTFVY
ncbi:hypothetical protein ACFOUP_13140, partial [Belliella kenyensis]